MHRGCAPVPPTLSLYALSRREEQCDKERKKDLKNGTVSIDLSLRIRASPCPPPLLPVCLSASVCVCVCVCVCVFVCRHKL